MFLLYSIVFMLVCTFMLSVAVFIGGALTAILVWTLTGNDFASPRTRMVSYVMRQTQDVVDYSPDDLPLDHMSTFADTACVKTNGVEAARHALAVQLRGLPSSVRDELIFTAVIEQASIETAHQNTSHTLTNDGVAFSYLYYINSRFTPTDTYEVCVSATGVRIEIAEVVAEWIEERREDIIGYEPCHCIASLYCRACPITKEVTTRTPIFKRHGLSMSQHRALRGHMLRQAHDQVHALGDAAQSAPNQHLPDWNIDKLLGRPILEA